MRRYSDDLKRFLNTIPARQELGDSVISQNGRWFLRALKSAGERATKGREVSECGYDAQARNGGVNIQMVMEGRHAMSVGHQVARRFEGMNELEFVDVVKTKTGAKVIMRVLDESAKSDRRAALNLLDKLKADGHSAEIVNEYSGKGMMGATTVAVALDTSDRELANQIATGKYAEDAGWRVDVNGKYFFYNLPSSGKRGYSYW